jgi:hypothetical protein
MTWMANWQDSRPRPEVALTGDSDFEALNESPIISFQPTAQSGSGWQQLEPVSEMDAVLAD